MTYTTAIERDALRKRALARRIDSRDVLLVLTSCVAVLAIGLAYLGRSRAVDVSGHHRLVDLNTVRDAAQLEPALEPLFPNLSDRRFAARELFRFLASRGDDRAVPNVGVIMRVAVPVERVEREPRLVEYSERLRLAREAAAAAGRELPRTLPLLTPADLATLKPSLVVRTRETFRRLALLHAALYVAGFHIVALVWRLRGTRGDRLLLAAAHVLTALAFAALLSRPDPLRDSLLFVRFTDGVLVGLTVMAIVSLIRFRTAAFLELSYIPLLGALFLSALLILFGSGPGTSNVKVNLGPVQPIEAIRLLLALFLAGYFARKWELLRQTRGESIRTMRVPAWLNLPRGPYVLPVLVGVATALAFFFLQRDLGPALFLSCVFLAMYAVARGRVAMALAGLALLVAGFYLGYRLHISATLADRVAMWQSPWDNAVRGGDQIAQAIWALSTGGLFGTGLGLGDTRYLPAGHTDLALAAVGEELGAVGLTVVLVVYAAMAWRGFRIGLTSPNDYGFFLATAVTLFLVVPVFVMGAGLLGVIPLTGVVTPFLSYGGSAMTANLAALGILAAIRSDTSSRASVEPFRVPMLRLAGALGAGALGLVVALLNVQIVKGDELVMKPQLSLQADGVRRYQYNPRVLDVIRQIPRGTVFDRQGLPLATDSQAVALGSRDQYRKLGVSIDDVCSNAGERCYPLGGRAFHLLGDSRTRVNWSATNTSYVEREEEARLRGFDDHATAMRTTDASGRSALAMRRDYRELLPIVRHRYEPDYPAAKALMARPRDVHLTIDARLQFALTTILQTYARASGGKAAAAVLDPDTGELLAAASYPWPVADSSRDRDDSRSSRERDALLDRARYGLYPPGSTFKVVTAAAALRQNIALSRTRFACTRLPDGRVGAKIAGWGRPIRDDVLDTRPHGTIDMHDGLVHSCNAYFAQLAVRLGPDALLDAAGRAGISLTPSSSTQRVREMLPQAAYGQGDVLATPLRMARIAAAFGAEGVLREPRLEKVDARSVKGEAWLPPEAARLLASYLRDVVDTGTGRRLAAHPSRIAGKTGTAEVGGSASHAWFIGFAPFGAATKRVAFAVILENAGYGGRAAAPVAGEIVTAAAAAGLIK